MATPVRRESRDHPVLLVSRVFPAPLDPLVRLASLATRVCPVTKVFQDLLVSRESVETPALPVLPDPRDLLVPVDPLELLDPMVERESPVLLVLLVPLDTKDPVECPVSVVLPVLLDPRGRRVRVDTEDSRVTWEETAPAEPPDQADLLDPPELTEKRVSLAPSALLDLLAFVDPLESVERSDLQVPLASPDPMVLTVSPDQEETRDPLEERETQDPLEPPGPPAKLDLLVLPDLLGPLVLVVMLDLLV